MNKSWSVIISLVDCSSIEMGEQTKEQADKLFKFILESIKKNKNSIIKNPNVKNGTKEFILIPSKITLVEKEEKLGETT